MVIYIVLAQWPLLVRKMFYPNGGGGGGGKKYTRRRSEVKVFNFSRESNVTLPLTNRYKILC